MLNDVAVSRLDLAAGISRGAVARLRSGRGSLTSLRKALEAAGMDLRGLPRGRNWGERVAAQRKRKGLSQAAVACRADVSREAVIALEKRSAGRVSTLAAVLRALGVRLAYRSLAPGGFYAGPALSSARSTWRTPQWVLDKLYGIFEFDVDAAAANPPNVRAWEHYHENSLFRPWAGCVYMNPPYGKGIGL